MIKTCPCCGISSQNNNKLRLYCSKTCREKQWRRNNPERFREYLYRWRKHNHQKIYLINKRQRFKNLSAGD